MIKIIRNIPRKKSDLVHAEALDYLTDKSMRKHFQTEHRGSKIRFLVTVFNTDCGSKTSLQSWQSIKTLHKLKN